MGAEPAKSSRKRGQNIERPKDSERSRNRIYLQDKVDASPSIPWLSDQMGMLRMDSQGGIRLLK